MTTAIVIGGGIAGCSAAYALTKRGINVTLLERRAEIAQEASGNPLAMLYPKLSVKPSLQSAISLLGFHFTLDLLAKLSNSATFFNACGQIQLAFNAAEKAKQYALLQGDYNQINQQLVQFLDAHGASELAGIALKSTGIFLPQAGWVNPRLFCAALCNHALIKLQINANVISIQPNKNGWYVNTKNNVFEAENVVICNANDIKQFDLCNSVQITPVRGQIEFFAPNAASENLKTIICSENFVSPSVAGLHSIGTTYSINTAQNDFNTQISAIDTQSNLAVLGKISPELLHKIDIKLVTSRVAYRSQTLDYRPLAGQMLNEMKLRENPPRYNVNPNHLPWLQGLYVNAGHGSKGMITAPLCSELIASLICNATLPIDAKLASCMNPNRFLLRELGLKQLAASLYT